MRIMGILIIIGMTIKIQIVEHLTRDTTYLHTRNLGSTNNKESYGNNRK
jgi:hypothetical protein